MDNQASVLRQIIPTRLRGKNVSDVVIISFCCNSLLIFFFEETEVIFLSFEVI